MLSFQEFCIEVQLDPRTLQVWIEEGWIVPRQAESGQGLSEVDIARARLIRDLKQDLGVNDEGIGVILDLVDQVHGLRLVVRSLVERQARSE